MLKLSKKVEYALIALLHISEKDPSELISARELSEIYHIPPELLGKVLQSLTKAGLISSIQGVKGGYYLAQSLEKISIDQVINVVEGPIKIVKCVEKNHSSCKCRQMDFCTIRNPMDILQQKINNFFKNISLQKIKMEMKNTISV
jgi:Rrf2 family nitric oxide-sensitive transcriptional repressor